MRVLPRVLFVCGALLAGFWVIARLHTLMASQVAIAQIRAPQKTESVAPAPTQITTDAGMTIDTTLWSVKRIAEFEQALHIQADPPLGVITIPRIGVEAPIFAGTDDVTLNRGIGWIKGTPKPGEPGNSGIAGHRDGFFRPLKDIAVGDRIEMRTPDGMQTFSVESLTIVDPKDVSVLAPTKDPVLTLVTCYPFYFVGSAPNRFIVRAVRAPQSQVASAARKR
jgi:sortase A